MVEFKGYNNGQIAAGRGAGLFIAVGFICAILSLFAYPFIFGVVGVISGILSTKRGSRLGLAAILTSILFMGIGLIFSGTLSNYVLHWLGMR